jgi:hypothetical protein
MFASIGIRIASALEHIEAGLHARGVELLKELHADIAAAEATVKARLGGAPQAEVQPAAAGAQEAPAAGAAAASEQKAS